MKNRISLKVAAIALSLAFAVPASAAHNNPWATPEDDVLAKKHDGRQEKSADTPGQDEMRGTMDRDVTADPGRRGMSGPRSGNGAGGGAGAAGGGHGGR